MFPTITFATACWERDWRQILLHPHYLDQLQIQNHLFPFAERLLVINNVSNLSDVLEAAQKKVEANSLTRVVIAEDVFPFFQLARSDFDEWQYFNALAPLNAIYHTQTDYLLYQTGDVYLKEPVSWIHQAVRFMEKKKNAKVANLTWNDLYKEAHRESYRRTWNFYLANRGFSDQMFLVKTKDFKAPIYNEIRPDAAHYPRGDVFEKRVFSYMKNRGWERITFKGGSYTHENL